MLIARYDDFDHDKDMIRCSRSWFWWHNDLMFKIMIKGGLAWCWCWCWCWWCWCWSWCWWCWCWCWCRCWCWYWSGPYWPVKFLSKCCLTRLHSLCLPIHTPTQLSLINDQWSCMFIKIIIMITVISKTRIKINIFTNMMIMMIKVFITISRISKPAQSLPASDRQAGV